MRQRKILPPISKSSKSNTETDSTNGKKLTSNTGDLKLEPRLQEPRSGVKVVKPVSYAVLHRASEVFHCI